MSSGVTIGTDFKVHIVNTTATCTCGWVTTQGSTDRAILVSEWHLRSHATKKELS
jgi:hypothetical protein